MPGEEICDLGIGEIHDLYRRRVLSPVEVVDACLDRIERLNPALNAFVTLDPDGARRAARQAEAILAKQANELPYLFGIPFSVKDTLPTAGMRTTFGASFFADFVPGEDAAVVAYLKRDGCILLGKTNSPAFGWTGVTDNRVFGATPNPWNQAFVAGGSSGGAAVAAVARLCPINIGTDGGGSLRIPASFTETVGFKGSSGRVPIRPTGGGIPLQHVGAIARTVDDAARIFANIAKPDPRDLCSVPGLEGDFVDEVGRGIRPIRIVYAESLGYTVPLDREMAALCRSAVATFRELGCDVVEKNMSWPSPEGIWKSYFTSALARNLAQFESRLDELDPELADLVEGAMKEPPDFLRAVFDRNEWANFPLSAHDDCDLLITPVTLCTPFPSGHFWPPGHGGGEPSIYGWMPFAYPFNLTGQPAVSVPAGRTGDGLPAGIQIVGPRYADLAVMRAASAFEQARTPLAPWEETILDRRTG